MTMKKLIGLYEKGTITYRECMGQLLDYANEEELNDLPDHWIQFVEDYVKGLPESREGMDELIRFSLCCNGPGWVPPTEEEKAAYEKEWRDKMWKGIVTIREHFRVET